MMLLRGRPSIWCWRDHSAGRSREAGDSHAARQSTFDGGLDEIGRKEGERDRHVDLADAAASRASRCFRRSPLASAISSLSQRRPRAIDATKVARVSDRIGRASLRSGRSRAGESHGAALMVSCATGHEACLSPSLALTIDLLRWCKLDDQLLRLDLDARNVGVDEAPVVNRLRWLEMLPNRSCDQRLDLGCRHSAYRSGAFGLALEQGGRQIVPVLDAPLADVARRHAIAAVIEDAAGQQGLGLHPCGLVIVHLFGQLGLDGIEQVPIDNGRLLARPGPHP